MKKLAFWARDHKKTARTAIIISYFFINLLALFLGDLIHSLNIEFTPLFFIFASVLTIVGWMIYPSKSRKAEYRNFFTRQKSADLLLISATFLFIVYAGNSLNRNWNASFNPVQAISVIYPSSTDVTEAPSTKTSVSKKSFSKKFRAQIKSIRKAYKESSKSQKTLYIILAVLGAALLTYGLAGLACSISCSGSEALAIVVLIVGLGGIIFGAVKLIQRITRGKPKM